MNDSDLVHVNYDACLKVELYRGRVLPMEAIGTFKNGILEGPGKVTFDDQSSIISTFSKGDIKGMVRRFDNKKQLEEIYYQDIRPKGFSWHRHNNY